MRRTTIDFGLALCRLKDIRDTVRELVAGDLARLDTCPPALASFVHGRLERCLSEENLAAVATKLAHGDQDEDAGALMFQLCMHELRVMWMVLAWSHSLDQSAAPRLADAAERLDPWQDSLPSNVATALQALTPRPAG